MRPLTIVGILLIALGVIGLVTGGMSYTKNKESADLGPIDIEVHEKERVAFPAWASIASIVGGVVLLVAGARRGTT